MSRIQKSEEKANKPNVYVGIDVHGVSFQVTPFLERVEQRSRRFPSSGPDLLSWSLEKYPGAKLIFGYEAGFSGLWLSRYLQEQGYECKVLHPSDIPTTDKERAHKNDRRDSRKIGSCLRTGEYNEIHQIGREQEELRQLVRSGIKYSRMLKVSQQRIRQGLNFRGYGKEGLTPRGKKSWSKATIRSLRKLAEEQGFQSLLVDLEYYTTQKKALKEIWLRVDSELRKSSYKEYYIRYQTTPGVGPLLSAILTVEIGEMDRFSNTRSLKGYCGIVPGEKSSGEKVKADRMSYRGNRYLRWALIQASRRAIQHDYELAKLYTSYTHQYSNEKKAVVKVAATLLSRMRRMILDKKDYKKQKPTE